MNEWMKNLSRQERNRLAEIDRFNSAAIPFLQALYEEILTDIASFKAEFSGASIESAADWKRGFIEVANHSHGNPPPSVRVTTNPADQTLMLTFSFRQNLNKELPMAIVDGTLLADTDEPLSMGLLSQVVLAPILFPELTTTTLLDRSLTVSTNVR